MSAPLKSKLIRDTRISLSVPKEMYSNVKALAQINDTSINDYIFKLIEKDIKKNALPLDKYNAAKLSIKQNLNDDD